ncbi:uncharacterized protein BX663DRAFT_499438 [Cokeromyces recurvatus]|uniref:uncharacterized protein n=1 Tax=Cokeromyces recurvatus TaxID=90255 RepID=UPI00221F592A|nr:uncharacterized protein BX663DRAFT_499438 [Cokeromyces recurvatus]KAI7906265.1 hypothetical protein BX663DRAFT_499438 [Cokeromyces recurvatus]
MTLRFSNLVGMHWHLWRIRRRQRERFQQTNRVDATTLQKRVMDTESLALFPVHVFGLSHHRESISSSRVTIQHGEQLGSEKVQQQENHDFPLVDESTCVICLDEFAAGDQIRELPCGHEYHCECIDPWLTIKSASCPLCKYDCSIYCKQPDIITSPTPPPPTLLRSTQNRSPHAFGPTISADRAEEFSRSWMARSLPRNMQRQIRDVVQQQQETVIELPARMTTPIHHHHHHTTTPSNQIIEENNTLNHRGTNRRFINLFVPKFISSRIP